jgi:IclR family transcriptional regulator, acetate operon repressor
MTATVTLPPAESDDHRTDGPSRSAQAVSAVSQSNSLAAEADLNSARSVLGRASALLQAFSPERPILSLGDLAACANLPKSTTHRIAATLVGCGVLQRYGAFGYCVGSWLHDIGMLAPARYRLTTAAAPFLHELHEQTRATVHLGVCSPSGPLYLDKVSRYGGPASFTRPGSHFPMHSTALGKSLAAFTSAAGDDLLAESGYRRLTPRTVTSPQALARELAAVRADQLSHDREETVRGISCIAVPVFDHFGHCLAAISVCTPTVRLDERRTTTALRRAAQNVGRVYGDPGATRPA